MVKSHGGALTDPVAARMQSLTWYLQRLRSMSPEEVTWRLQSAMRDAVGRYRIAWRLYPSAGISAAEDGRAEAKPGFRVSDLQVGEWLSVGPDDIEFAWYARLRRQADQIVRHRLSFFNLEDRELGFPIDWNRDHDSGKRTPLGYAPSIDYRDYQVTGDAKVVWEPNRHHHLVVLGRAYRTSADLSYARELVEQIESWLQQCPFGMGVNWRSPLELAVRLINWVWAIDFIKESGLFAGEFRSRLLRAVYLHLWEITRKYSRGSSANNHRIGEAAGVFIATSYFRELDGARRWRDESYAILAEEILAQTYPCGGSREQALGYHLFILQLLLVAGVVARHAGGDFPSAYWSRLERMFEFAGALAKGGHPVPMFGDCDDAYVLDLGGGHSDFRGLLSVGAVLFGRPDLKALSGGYSESARWLLGRSSRAQFDALPTGPATEALVSRAFPEAGYYLLQCGRQGRPDAISVVFDCGELGFKSIAAHGHADALSFTLRALGGNIFVDPGTYDYFSFPAWREYFRSTRAHNTVMIDDVDQSATLGPFLWGVRARARCLEWQPRGGGGKVVGEHDGYTRLAEPVVHRRTIELDAEAGTLAIVDDLLTRGSHNVAVYFHLSEHCAVSSVQGNRYEIAAGAGTAVLEMDPRLAVETLRGCEQPIGGWVSRGYHSKVPSTTIVGRARVTGNSSFRSCVYIGIGPHEGDRG